MKTSVQVLTIFVNLCLCCHARRYHTNARTAILDKFAKIDQTSSQSLDDYQANDTVHVEAEIEQSEGNLTDRSRGDLTLLDNDVVDSGVICGIKVSQQRWQQFFFFTVKILFTHPVPGINYKTLCTGTVSGRIVITAAHCVCKQPQTQDENKMGMPLVCHDQTPDAFKVQTAWGTEDVEKVAFHPNFLHGGRLDASFDVAILYLRNDRQYQRIFFAEDHLSVGDTLDMAGFGGFGSNVSKGSNVGQELYTSVGCSKKLTVLKLDQRIKVGVNVPQVGDVAAYDGDSGSPWWKWFADTDKVPVASSKNIAVCGIASALWDRESPHSGTKVAEVWRFKSFIEQVQESWKSERNIRWRNFLTNSHRRKFDMPTPEEHDAAKKKDAAAK